jgi:hypothetical protein
MTESGPSSAPKKLKWWQRPIVWVTTVILGAAAAYLTDVIVSWAKSVPQALGPPVAVVDLARLHDPFVGRWGYVVAGSVDPAPVLGEDAGGSDLAAWAEANAGIDVNISAWELTLEGRRNSPVELVNIVPILEERCGQPLGGGLYSDEPQGETEKILLDIDVSAERPTVTRSDPEAAPIENFFASKKITLPKGEKNVLVLRGRSDLYHCRWRYRFDLIADGERTTLTLSAPGDRPFEVTGENPNYGVYDWVVPPAFLACGARRPKIDGRDFERRLQGGCPGG